MSFTKTILLLVMCTLMARSFIGTFQSGKQDGLLVCFTSNLRTLFAAFCLWLDPFFDGREYGITRCKRTISDGSKELKRRTLYAKKPNQRNSKPRGLAPPQATTTPTTTFSEHHNDHDWKRLFFAFPVICPAQSFKKRLQYSPSKQLGIHELHTPKKRRRKKKRPLLADPGGKMLSFPRPFFTLSL